MSEKQKGSEHKISEGYVEIKTESGWNYKHRHVATKNLDRELKDNEIVHHIDGDKTNNSWDNLEVMTLSEHTAQHNKGKTIAVLECPQCGSIFERVRNQTFLVKSKSSASFCSHECKGRYYALGNKTPEGKKYVVEVYKE